VEGTSGPCPAGDDHQGIEQNIDTFLAGDQSTHLALRVENNDSATVQEKTLSHYYLPRWCSCPRTVRDDKPLCGTSILPACLNPMSVKVTGFMVQTAYIFPGLPCQLVKLTIRCLND
jgi:hypothetical protein